MTDCDALFYVYLCHCVSLCFLFGKINKTECTLELIYVSDNSGVWSCRGTLFIVFEQT